MKPVILLSQVIVGWDLNGILGRSSGYEASWIDRIHQSNLIVLFIGFAISNWMEYKLEDDNSINKSTDFILWYLETLILDFEVGNDDIFDIAKLSEDLDIINPAEWFKMKVSWLLFIETGSLREYFSWLIQFLVLECWYIANNSINFVSMDCNVNI